MHLCLAGSLQTMRNHNFHISITHYKFGRHFEVLMKFLRGISHRNGEIHILLSDISLEFNPTQEIISKYQVSVRMIDFADVSTDFISAFFSAITFANWDLQFVSFYNCVIPRIGKLWRSKCTKIQARTTLMSTIYFSCIYLYLHYFSIEIFMSRVLREM